MPRYVVRIRTSISAAEAFEYTANLTNLTEWDPGVDRAEQAIGEGPGPSAMYDVTVKLPFRTMTLRYETVAYNGPANTMTAIAKHALMTSKDTISVEADGAGSIVTYDAELKLNGLLGLGNPLLGLAFNRIGDRAAAGLLKALSGERVAA